MNKTTLIIGIIAVALSAPTAAGAAFNFGSVSTDQLYLQADQNSTVVTQTREGVAIVPPDWATCEYEAQQAGLSESNSYWCVQKAIMGSIFPNNCVFLCQVGVGGGISSTTWPPSMTTRIFSAAPVGHPLSYYTSANASQQSAMDNDLLCLALPSFGLGCELKKHTPINAPPAATLVANPPTVIAGSASVLTWSSTNATSCTGTGFSTGGATSGSVSTGALSATTDYSVKCMTTSVTAAPGTWDLAESDISDMACPITNNNNVYSGVARCPANPQGKACSGEGSGSVCRVSTVSNEGVGGGGCFVYTDVYTCKQSSGIVTPPPSATAYASVAVTPESNEQWVNQGCGEITQSYNNTCNKRAELVDITCPVGSRMEAQDSYTCPIATNNNPFKSARRCVVDAACNPPPTVANLTAGAVSPTTATQGTAVTLSSVISNNGGGPTGAPFTDIFQVATDPAGAGATVIGTFTSGIPNGFPALYSEPNAQVTYTFGTVGTKYVRACADNNASWVGAITESNEADNCGPWTAVTVANSCTGASCLPGGGTLSCVAAPATLTAGGSSTWTASPSGLGTYAWTPSETGAAISGTQILPRTYPSAGTYAMSVNAGGATASCTNSVTVGKQACGVAVPSISALPTRVQTGGTSTLTVSASGVDGTCTVTGPGVSQTISSGTSCTVPSTTIPTGAITSLSTYTISCDSGEASSKVLVNVVPKIQEF